MRDSKKNVNTTLCIPSSVVYSFEQVGMLLNTSLCLFAQHHCPFLVAGMIVESLYQVGIAVNAASKTDR